MSLHIWATHTLTLSYTRITSVQVQTLLLAFPRIAIVATPQPNLDSAFPIKKRFLLRERQDNVFKCDYVSTTILQTDHFVGQCFNVTTKTLIEIAEYPQVSNSVTPQLRTVSRPHNIASSPSCVIIITKSFYFIFKVLNLYIYYIRNFEKNQIFSS